METPPLEPSLPPQVPWACALGFPPSPAALGALCPAPPGTQTQEGVKPSRSGQVHDGFSPDISQSRIANCISTALLWCNSSQKKIVLVWVFFPLNLKPPESTYTVVSNSIVSGNINSDCCEFPFSASEPETHPPRLLPAPPHTHHGRSSGDLTHCFPKALSHKTKGFHLLLPFFKI